MQDGANVFSVEIATFEQNVIERSKNCLVLLDFWAEWCGPCKQLTPLLTQVVESYDGRVVLAKVNADEEQDLAKHLNIRSLPTVVAVRDGQIVDGFMGVQPEAGIRAFITKHLPEDDSEPENSIDLTRMDASQALAEIEAAIDNDPDNLDLKFDRLLLLIRLGDVDAAKDYLTDIKTSTEAPEIRLKNFALRIELLEMTENAEEESLLFSLASNPTDWGSMSQLAALRTKQENYSEAMDIFLTIVRGDRTYGEDFGRRALLSLFDTISDDDLVRSYRRSLASALF